MGMNPDMNLPGGGMPWNPAYTQTYGAPAPDSGLTDSSMSTAGTPFDNVTGSTVSANGAAPYQFSGGGNGGYGGGSSGGGGWNGGPAGQMLGGMMNGNQMAGLGQYPGRGPSGGVGGGFYNPQLASQLAASYSKNYADAKAANLGRYNQLLNADTQLRNRQMTNANTQLTNSQNLQTRGMADWNNYAGAQNSVIDQNYTSDKQAEQMRLASSGLSNSTVQQNAQYGLERQRSQSLGLLARDQIGVDQQLTGNVQGSLQNRAATDEQNTGNLTGVIERRSDPYPSFDEYTNQMLKFGQMGAFGAGGYGGAGANGQGQMTSPGSLDGVRNNPNDDQNWATSAAGGNMAAMNRVKAATGQSTYGGWGQTSAVTGG